MNCALGERPPCTEAIGRFQILPISREANAKVPGQQGKLLPGIGGCERFRIKAGGGWTRFRYRPQHEESRPEHCKQHDSGSAGNQADDHSSVLTLAACARAFAKANREPAGACVRFPVLRDAQGASQATKLSESFAGRVYFRLDDGIRGLHGEDRLTAGALYPFAGDERS